MSNLDCACACSPDSHQAVYTLLREAEHRSMSPIPYWDLPGAKVGNRELAT